MMRHIGVRSIRYKLLLIVLAANFGMLIVAAAALLYNDLREYRQALISELTTHADIIGQASVPALEFNDPQAATENLALLRAKPEVLAAAIYTVDGTLFAQYVRAGGQTDFPALPAADEVRTHDGELSLFRRVANSREPVGTVYLKARYGLRQRLSDYLNILGAVMLASLVVGLFISGSLQSYVTRAIQSVTAVAQQVMEQRDFHLRARKTTDDEIGVLVDAFNGMLGEIGDRTEALESSKQALEHEIAERRDIQRSLQTSEMRNRSLVTAMSSVIWVSDRVGGFQEPQPSWSAYTGQPPEHYGGLGWRTAFHTDDQAALERRWAAAVDGGQPFELAARLWHAGSGRFREVMLRAIPLTDEQGGVAEWIGSILDEDDRRSAEREVRRLNAELEERVAERTAELEVSNRALVSRTEDAEAASRAKADFLANMSHEIRTPMNAVLGLAYLLERSALGAEARDLVRKIRGAGQSLQSIINDILDFSKIEAGQLEIEHAPFRLGDILDNLANIMGANAGDKDLELIIGAPPEIAGSLVGDALRLGQVLINLTSNAIKFTSHGEVVVAVSLIEQGDKFSQFSFSVSDTGIGIPADKQAQIFSAFAQADTSTTRRFGGTGLGLTICRHLVTKMGGEIGVISEPGRGSEFWFTVPLERASARVLAPQNLLDLDLLVADDNAIARANLTGTAVSLGWRAVAVDSGEAALRQVIDGADDAREFDVVVLDWKMPGMDGLAAAEAIRQVVKADPLPIVIMATAYSRDELAKRAGIDLVDATLNKPVTGSSLYNAVAEALHRRGTGTDRLIETGNRSARIPGVRVLVVDDSDINREVAQRILEADGAVVSLVNDGAAAIDWLLGHPGAVDVVLMDVQMPVMDGYAATSRIRQIASLADLPVVALTAGAFKMQQDAARAAGMNGFVAKPFDVDELIETVRRMAGREPAPPGKAGGPPPPVEPQAATASPIDMQQALRVWQDAAIYQRVLTTFATHYADAPTVLAGLLDQRDRKGAAALLHKMKGAAGSLVLTEIAAIAGRMEGALARDEDLVAESHQLRDALDRTLAAIGQLARPPAEPARPAEAPIDPDRAGPLLDAMLRALDTDSPDRAEELLVELAPLLPTERISELSVCLEAFDFRAAETVVHRLVADIGTKSKE